MQRAKETSFKNIKNCTDFKLLNGCQI